MKYVILLNFLAAPRETFLIKNKIDTRAHTHREREREIQFHFVISILIK